MLGLLSGARLRFWGSPADFEEYVGGPEFAFQALFFVVTLQICFYYGDLYDFTAIRNRWDQLISVGQSLGAASLFLGMMYFIFPALLIGRGVFFISTALVATFVLITRVALDAAWRIAAAKQKILILGAGKSAHLVAHELTQRNDLNLEVSGFLNPASGRESGAEFSAFPVLGSMEDLETVVRENQISRIVVALEDRRGSLPIRDLVRLRVGGIRVEDAHSTLAALSGRIWLGMVQPSWFIFSNGFHRSRFTLALKRMLDLSFGLLGLALSAPLMALVAAAIRLDSRGPVLYSQERVGYKGRCFRLLKFRSMREDAEAAGAQWAQKNDRRATRIGKYLRKFRLDELPQFINVIRGEMSFVGPRPERPVFVDQLRDIISYYDERHSVRPGLTGWAQVQYAYGASIDDAFRKVEYDLFYLKNMSIVFDCVIILKTIRIVLTGRGSH
jgi:sugar transferase (PEP-CTERM system associated)